MAAVHGELLDNVRFFEWSALSTYWEGQKAIARQRSLLYAGWISSQRMNVKQESYWEREGGDSARFLLEYSANI
jgi:hypothetical protein